MSHNTWPSTETKHFAIQDNWETRWELRQNPAPPHPGWHQIMATLEGNIMKDATKAQRPSADILERRWSSRRFPYGYLVTTSPQSLTLPWSAASLRLANRLRVKPTPMVWRAVCTRPGNVFTAPCWCAITSDSTFTHPSCRMRSELRRLFRIGSASRPGFPLSPPL